MKDPTYGHVHVGDYVAVFRAIQRTRHGLTVREVWSRASPLTTWGNHAINQARINAVLTWMAEHELAWRRMIGTRQDPRDDDARITVYVYGAASAVTEEYMLARLQAIAEANKHNNVRETKVYDAAALVAAWSGLPPGAFA